MWLFSTIAAVDVAWKRHFMHPGPAQPTYSCRSTPYHYTAIAHVAGAARAGSTKSCTQLHVLANMLP
jgi:hypothetical protein